MFSFAIFSSWQRGFAAIMTVALLAFSQLLPAVAGDAAVKAVQEAAYGGRFAEGIAKLEQMSRADPADVEAVFGLGALRFGKALADMQKGVYDHTGSFAAQGFGDRFGMAMMMPFGPVMDGGRLVPPNPNATPMTYGRLRELLQALIGGLTEAEQSLSKVGDRPVKIALKPFQIGIDLDHDGMIGPGERVIESFFGRGRRLRNDAFDAELAFDTADASWLRGYANVLLASANFILAFDFEPSYAVAGHLAYGDNATAFGRELARQIGLGRSADKINAELDELRTKLAEASREAGSRRDIDDLRRHLETLDPTRNVEERKLLSDALQSMIDNQAALSTRVRELETRQRRLAAELQGTSSGWIYDAVAFIHTLNWKVVEPQRLEAARQHLLQVMAINKNTWRLVRAETDNDREWLPNPSQDGPFGAARIDNAIIDSWLRTTALATEVLNGDKLLPHPRFRKGFNLRKLFQNAKRMDFVMLATGHDLLPYLEDGDVVDEATWQA
ncbi:MAG: hypothetical protein KKB37_13680, partial [Alphaproteobacteria bacterium]|nr:hypothetical protein [Alphaproteobacteria bacterium]